MSMIVKDILNMGTVRLAGAGCMEAKLDAELLLCHLLGIDKSRLFMSWGKDLNDDWCEAFFDLLERRCTGMPLQHITGWQEFMGLRFSVSEKVLIPRQETEVLVDTALMLLRERKAKTVLDLCTGSGAIAVSLDRLGAADHKVGKLEITASDISREALAVARSNAKALGADKIKFVCGDLFVPFDKKFRAPKFDLIISNPPYIERSVIPTLQREVRDHEPLLALDGGEDGLDLYRRIITQAPRFLRSAGILLLEIGAGQAAAVRGLAAACGQYDEADIFQDLAGRDRIAILCLKEAGGKR